MQMVPPPHDKPKNVLAWLDEIGSFKYGQNWSTMVEKTEEALIKLTGIKLVSQRDSLIFNAVLFFGLTYAVPIAEALSKTRKPSSVMKRFLKVFKG